MAWTIREKPVHLFHFKESESLVILLKMFDRFTGKQVGMTERYFNPINNELEHKLE